MEIVDFADVLLGVVAQLVGISVRDTTLDAAAGHEHGVALDVMITAVALGHGCPAELTPEYHQGVIEKAPLLQVLDESRRRPVDLPRGRLDVVLDSSVMIPGAMIDLDEADTTLGEPPGEQSIRRVAAIGALGAVQLEGLGGLIGNVDQPRHRGLHPEGHLVL